MAIPRPKDRLRVYTDDTSAPDPDCPPYDIVELQCDQAADVKHAPCSAAFNGKRIEWTKR